MSPGGPITDFNFEGAKEVIEDNAQIYPNPTSDLINIRTSGSTYDNATIGVFNANGQMLKTTKHLGQQSVIDLSDFDNGLYIIQIYKSNGETEIFKIVKT